MAFTARVVYLVAAGGAVSTDRRPQHALAGGKTMLPFIISGGERRAVRTDHLGVIVAAPACCRDIQRIYH